MYLILHTVAAVLGLLGYDEGNGVLFVIGGTLAIFCLIMDILTEEKFPFVQIVVICICIYNTSPWYHGILLGAIILAALVPIWGIVMFIFGKSHSE